MYEPDTSIPRRDIGHSSMQTHLPVLPARMAAHLRDRLDQFLVDKGTGNVVLNIKDGQVLKLVIEEHIKG
jgi:hypothetical protein